tara:strand:+ start:1319 stop:1738 length:420 start_codon:yes stop_codon:yes gene_type:complete
LTLLPPFHLAIPVHDLKVAQDFYGQLLNCQQGRSSDHWIDYNFFGHQLVVHLDKNINKKTFNAVDGKNIPIPHFGLVLDWIQWESLKQKLQKSNMEFIVDPYIRFKGQIGEQATMFFLDPSGNALEFKAFKNMDQLFAH